MYKDIINYELADGVSEEHLLKIASEIIETWMSKQKGFIRWEINKGAGGIYSDIVVWNSEQDAANAEKEMMNIPETIEWASCYKKGSISSRSITEISSFK